MSPDLRQRLEAALGSVPVKTTALGGGCIAAASRLDLENGEQVFLKTGGTTFPQEANGLRELAVGAIRVPEVLHVEVDFLVLEWIEPGPRRREFSTRFGQQLAALHRHTAERFGFREDNWIGTNPQPNRPGSDSWLEFFWEQRLAFQLRLAESNGRADDSLRLAFARLEKFLPSLLAGSEEPPALLHGDLWSGNFLVDSRGDPVLIDPAVYYGHREAELGMTHLFGGFDRSFYRAYDEAWPLPPGASGRIDLYKLYHVMNHLNLFGASYYQQALRLAQQV